MGAMSKHPKTTMKIVAATAAGACALASGAAAARSPAALWHQAMQCVRSHGYPSLRDPRLDAIGNADFGSQGPALKRALGQRSVQTACGKYFRQIPTFGQHAAVPPAELHQLVLFAQCIRRHGTPDWPDPRPDGSFPLPRRIVSQGKARIIPMIRPCQSLWNKRISFSAP
jgi:hypothetical protein